MNVNIFVYYHLSRDAIKIIMLVFSFFQCPAGGALKEPFICKSI